MILIAIAILCCSGLPSCLLSSMSTAGQWIAMFLMLLGSVTGLSGIVIVSLSATTLPTLSIPWCLPWGQFAVAVDPISIMFLLPVFIIPALGSIYGLKYWKQSEHSENGRGLVLFYGLLAGSMALVAIARDAVLFLIAWEIMAIAAFFAATAEDDNPEVCRAGWVYLVATHVGTLCLIAMFALWRYATNSFMLNPANEITVEMAGAIFVLAFIGFGFKAGIMPLHVWLPGAHANAPSHVSAVMSGVMLKMGVYGIIRITALLPVTTAWWGGATLAAGAITGVAGIAFAIGQNDIKKMLAYSSIENIGIIAMGLGLSLLGRSQNQPAWIILGLGGALMHMWNHSLFKSLLFFNAGAIIHASHTRNIDQMGGLSKLMPRTMILFIIGAIAICALPPLNGFASEWLIYSGLFQTLGIAGRDGYPVAAIAAVPLAMIGALAVACFVKMLGTIFLGTARCTYSHHAHDPSVSMMLPMTILAMGCISIGLFPILTIGWIDKAVMMWASLPEHTTLITTVAPLTWITKMSLAFILLACAITLALKALIKTSTIHEAGTWDCGYSGRTNSRIQYTGSSFGQTLVSLFSFILWPKTHWSKVRGVFPETTTFKSTALDTILDRLILPLFNIAGRYLPSLRIVQQGQTHFYVLYILIIVIILLICGPIGVK